MLAGLIRKLVQLAVVFVVVTFFTVYLMSLVPGKPVKLVIPFDASPNGQLTKNFNHENNLDRALPVRWAKWAGRFVTGDMGNRYSSTGKTPIRPLITKAAPVTILLIVYTQIVALLIAIPLAVWAAYRAGRRLDKLLSSTMFAFLSLPNFAVALILSYLLGVKLGWVKAQGYDSPSQGLVNHIKSVVVPVIALSLGQIAVYMRLLRSDLVATLQEDFILMAKSKGISNGRVLWRHALRPSSLTLLTVAGLNVGTLIGGTLVIEFLLGIPGMGQLLGEAILARQYVQLQSLVAVVAIAFVLINFLVDFLYTVLRPTNPGEERMTTLPDLDDPSLVAPGSGGASVQGAEPVEEDAPKKKKLGLGTYLAGGWLGLLLFVTIFADFLPLKNPDATVSDTVQLAPFNNGSLIMGTDSNGRDMLARLIYGSRNSLIIALGAVGAAFIIGGLLGLFAGYYRNWIGRVLASFFDILLAIPRVGPRAGPGCGPEGRPHGEAHPAGTAHRDHRHRDRLGTAPRPHHQSPDPGLVPTRVRHRRPGAGGRERTHPVP